MNRSVKVLTIAACAVLVTSTLASAQTPSAPAAPAAFERVSTPAPAPARAQVTFTGYEWQGFYAGGTFGYGGSISDTRFNFLPTVAEFGALPVTLNPEPMGWTYGFHGGWNLRSGNLIYGVEADYLWSSINGNVSLNPVFLDDGSEFDGTYSVQQDVEWLSTIRGRAGTMLKNKYFVYGTGGIAWGGITTFAEADYHPQGDIAYPATDDGSRTGWTIGAGIEGSLTPKLAWRAQFLYMDFGETSATANPVPANPPFQVQYDIKNATNSFTFGLSYRF